MAVLTVLSAFVPLYKTYEGSWPPGYSHVFGHVFFSGRLSKPCSRANCHSSRYVSDLTNIYLQLVAVVAWAVISGPHMRDMKETHESFFKDEHIRALNQQRGFEVHDARK